VPQRIVDVLEAVQVQIQHCYGADPRQRLLQPVMEQHAVGKACQRIVPGQKCHLRLGLLAFGDVLIAGEPAATLQRAIRHPHHLPPGQLFLEGNRLAGADQRHCHAVDLFGIAAVQVT